MNGFGQRKHFFFAFGSEEIRDVGIDASVEGGEWYVWTGAKPHGYQQGKEIRLKNALDHNDQVAVSYRNAAPPRTALGCKRENSTLLELVNRSQHCRRSTFDEVYVNHLRTEQPSHASYKVGILLKGGCFCCRFMCFYTFPSDERDESLGFTVISFFMRITLQHPAEGGGLSSAN